MFCAFLACLLGILCMLSPVFGTVIVYDKDIPHIFRPQDVMVRFPITEEFRDMPASFGPELPLDGLRGLLVVGEPGDGCGPLTKPPVDDNFTGKWIVLVARYNCNFEDKVRNAQLAGYDCAIVHNVNSSELETMSAKDDENITIPSVFVSDKAGAILSLKYTYNNQFYIMVNGDLPFDFNTHLLLPFAIVVVLCLIVILVVMIVKCIKDRRRAQRLRLPNRTLKKIPTCKFRKGDPYETCAICLDDYQEGERLRVLPCAHAYHMKCIDPWLTQSRRVCPVCKRRVFAAGERRPRRPHTDSDTDDTEPLVSDAPVTQGGTFEPQRENPFVRAARYISRLRGRDAPAEPDAEVAGLNNEEPANAENDDESEARPLLQPAGRRRRRQRSRSRRARSAPRLAPPPAAAAPTASAAAGSDRGESPTHHAANDPTAAQGEIGVAALPAPATRPGPAHHVDL